MLKHLKSLEHIHHRLMSLENFLGARVVTRPPLYVSDHLPVMNFISSLYNEGIECVDKDDLDHLIFRTADPDSEFVVIHNDDETYTVEFKMFDDIDYSGEGDYNGDFNAQTLNDVKTRLLFFFKIRRFISNMNYRGVECTDDDNLRHLKFETIEGEYSHSEFTVNTNDDGTYSVIFSIFDDVSYDENGEFSENFNAPSLEELYEKIFVILKRSHEMIDHDDESHEISNMDDEGHENYYMDDESHENYYTTDDFISSMFQNDITCINPNNLNNLHFHCIKKDSYFDVIHNLDGTYSVQFRRLKGINYNLSNVSEYDFHVASLRDVETNIYYIFGLPTN